MPVPISTSATSSTVSYVYDIPSGHLEGISRVLLANWEYSGITTFYTGTPFSVTNGIFGDNAGVANGVGTNGSYPDVVGNPHSAPPADVVASLGRSTGPLLFNPAAYTAPQGLTFGDAGRNSLNIPSRLNFDMALYKNFPIKETSRSNSAWRPSTFSITRSGTASTTPSAATAGLTIPLADASCTSAGWAGFLQPSGAHLGRIFQFGLKFLF